jgi:hypothetical protein
MVLTQTDFLWGSGLHNTGCDPSGVEMQRAFNALRATSCDPSGVEMPVDVGLTPEGSQPVFGQIPRTLLAHRSPLKHPLLVVRRPDECGRSCSEDPIDRRS